MSRPKKPLDVRKIEKVQTLEPRSTVEATEKLMIFDIRCLERRTHQELLRLIPELVHIRRAWKAHFAEHGCLSCHKKRTWYGGGGLCDACQVKITHRMLDRYKKLTAGRNTAEEIADLREALCRQYNAAQRLLT